MNLNSGLLSYSVHFSNVCMNKWLYCVTAYEPTGPGITMRWMVKHVLFPERGYKHERSVFQQSRMFVTRSVMSYKLLHETGASNESSIGCLFSFREAPTNYRHTVNITAQFFPVYNKRMLCKNICFKILIQSCPFMKTVRCECDCATYLDSVWVVLWCVVSMVNCLAI